MAEPRSFTRWLRDGERIVWAAAAVTPRALRRLGIPPRSTGQLLLHGAVLTALAVVALVGLMASGLELGARVALIAVGVAPPLILGGWALIPRSRAFAFTDQGRGLLKEGRSVAAFAVSAPPDVRWDPNREAGDLAFGAQEVEILDGPNAGQTVLREVCLRDVPYPHVVLDILSELLPGVG